MVAKANNPMEKKKTQTLAFFLFFFSKSILADDDCRPASCGPTEPPVRFPFRLHDRQPSHCGFPGFDLSCNNKNRTLLKLPSSQSFIIKRISYTSQVILVDPDFCRPERIADIQLTDTPFDFSTVESYTFFNCSSQNLGFTFQSVPMLPFPCLRSVNHSVFAVRTGWIPLGDIPASCKQMTTISIPIRRYGNIRNELTLMWFRPYCKSCELDGRTCGLQSDDGETACFGSSSTGIPRSAKYGLSIGIGVPALICIFGLACYTFSKMRNYNHRRRHRIDLFSIAITPQPPSTTGLDRPTIESYPKTLWGENPNLPNNDSTCAICLSDYEPKEAIRTIPECNHYFHADCVDEWLKLNATCPVCRNSPEDSSLVTPCFSMNSDSSNSSRGMAR